MTEAMESAAVFALRSSQALALSLPTILAGMLTAGALRVLIGPERLRRWLASGSRADLLRAWCLGLLLPACAMGILPILKTLRDVGIPAAALVVLGLSGPVLLPWTMGYLLDAIGMFAFAWLVLTNFVVAVAAGWMMPRQRASGQSARQDAPLAARPMVAVLVAAGRSMSKGVMCAILIGCVGVGALAMFIPPNEVGHWFVEREMPHALVLCLIALFTYSSPGTAVMQAGEIIQSSTMPGLLMVFAIVGTVMNLGVLFAAWKVLGWRRATAGLLITLGLTAGAAALADIVLYDSAYRPEDSHAFEDTGRPFHLLDHPDGGVAGLSRRWMKPITNAVPLAGAAVVGLILLYRLQSRVDPPPRKEIPLGDLGVTSVVVGAVAATLIMAVYTYFPPPAAIAADLRTIAAEVDAAWLAQGSGNADRHRNRLERRLGQIAPALIVRRGSVPPGVNERIIALQAAMQHATLDRNGPDDDDRLRFHRALSELARVLQK